MLHTHILLLWCCSVPISPSKCDLERPHPSYYLQPDGVVCSSFMNLAPYVDVFHHGTCWPNRNTQLSTGAPDVLEVP